MYQIPLSNQSIIFGLNSETKPASVLPDSLFFETNTGNIYLFNGSVWVLPTKLKRVYSLADFPEPVSSVITLEDNITYQISGTVNIGTNRIVVGIKNTIFGQDRQNDILISSTTGNMFTMDNSVTPKVALIFDNLTLRATDGTLLNVSGGTTDQITFITTSINNTLTGGSLSGIAFSMRTSSISSGFSTGGFTFTGTNTSFVLRDSTISNNVGTAFNMTSATFTSSVLISRNFILTNATQTFINLTSTVITIAGQIALTVFSGAGTQITGITAESVGWLFSNNHGITNTASVLSLTNRTPNANVTINTNYSSIVSRKYTIASGTKLTLLSGSIFRIL